MAIPKKYLKELGELIAEGHRRFGKVAPRRPYQEDDEGGEGSAQLLFEEHPLLSKMPIGAPSDLTYNTQLSKFSAEAADERANELKLELQKKLEQKLEQKLTAKPKFNPTPYPTN